MQLTSKINTLSEVYIYIVYFFSELCVIRCSIDDIYRQKVG